MTSQRHPMNVPGPFYVVNEGCLACTAPEHVAPDLMAHVESPYYHCYFKKQPTTLDELEQACQAVLVACCEMVRYASNDPHVMARLEQLCMASSCDQPPPQS